MLTIFTPTYNRLYTIKKLYESLVAQSDKDFEWLVVDDGSQDGTQAYFDAIASEGNGFEIRYYRTPNGGKHRAINSGAQKARGEWFFIVDSDDALTPDAVETVKRFIADLPSDEHYAGVAACRGNENGKMIGTTFDSTLPYVDCTSARREAHGMTGDKAEVVRTELLKKYPFPEYEGERFCPEAVFWVKLSSEGYQFRWYSDILYVCEYLPDGLTKNSDGLYFANPYAMLKLGKIWREYYRVTHRYRLRQIKKVFSYYYLFYRGRKDKASIQTIAREIGVSAVTLRLLIAAYRLKGLRGASN